MWGESKDSKDTFCGEFEQVLKHFPKYHITILFGDFNAKVKIEIIFELTIVNESVYQESNTNGVRIVHFVTSENLVV
jgi:hypothetical protein